MAWAFVQSTGATGGGVNTIAAAYSSNLTATNLTIVVVQIKDITTTVTSVSDTLSNSYTILGGGPTTNATSQLWLYYAPNITGGASTVTVNFSTLCNPAISILEYSGLDTGTPFNAFHGGTGSDSSPTSGSLTTTLAPCMIFGSFFSTDSGDGRHPNGAFATRENANRIASFDRNAASTGSYSAFGTLDYGGAGAEWSCVAAAFQESGAGGGSSQRPPPIRKVIAAESPFLKGY